jgi:hypothetical protein
VKLLIDENLPPRLAALLSEAGHDAAHVRDLDAAGSSDPQIIDLALADGQPSSRPTRTSGRSSLDRRHRTVGHPRARGRRPPPAGARRAADKVHRAARNPARYRSDGRRDSHRRSGSPTPAAVALTADSLAWRDGCHVGGPGHRRRQRAVHPRRRDPFRTRTHAVVSRMSARMIATTRIDDGDGRPSKQPVPRNRAEEIRTSSTLLPRIGWTLRIRAAVAMTDGEPRSFR